MELSIILQMSIHTLIISFVSLLVVLGGVVWRTAYSISRKADKHEIEIEMKDKVDRREYDLHVKQQREDFIIYDVSLAKLEKEIQDRNELFARMDENIKFIKENCRKNNC